MKFKIDQNLPSDIADLLVGAGHDAMTVFDEDLVGEADDDILNVCQREGRAVLTMDLDFANVYRYPPERYPGLVVLRLMSQELTHMVGVVETMVLPLLAKHSPAGSLWVVEEDRVRIRSGVPRRPQRDANLTEKVHLALWWRNSVTPPSSSSTRNAQGTNRLAASGLTQMTLNGATFMLAA